MRPWFPKKMARLDEIAALESGWIDGNSGDAPTPVAIDGARRLVALIAMLTEVAPTLQVQIVPTADGGVSLEWHEGGWDAEIDIERDGKLWIWAHHGDRGVEFSYPPE